jgi:heat shock protein 4
MMAAKKNPQFRVIDYEIEEANFYTIRVGWLYNNTLDAVVK